VGIVRVSGPAVPRIAQALLHRLPPPRRAVLATFSDAAGEAIDQGIALYFPAPYSFTGEHVLELQGHGGSALIDLLLQRLLELGCRAARPGEFSERGFLNDKLDLAQAEGVADLIDASSHAAARAALRTLRGEFSSRVHALDAALKRLRIHVEAAIDFPEEEVDFLDDARLQENLERVFTEFDALTRAARQGVVLNDGLKIVLIGAPNVGKSSLMNALAGEDVAIVTDVPGTTRDVLRQPVRIGGATMNLVDTAGLRSSADQIEIEGMRRARAELAQADHVLLVTEPDTAATPPAELPPGIPLTVVINKIDLSGTPPRLDATVTPPRVFLSARGGEGVELLRAHLLAAAGLAHADAGAFTARRRHLEALRRAREHVDAAAGQLLQHHAFELFAEELRMAQNCLGEITGAYGSEDLLGDIFRSFCIGK
jgi:tRNA modification GTPase